MKQQLVTRRNVACAFAGLLAGLCLAAQGASAETYPARAVKLVVPFNAGGAADVVARLIGESISRRLGQSVIVENRAGATGATGSLVVSRSPPDGYTILMAVMSSHAVVPATRKEPAFDPIGDFTPIVRIGNSVQTLVVRKDFPGSNVQDFLKYAKANPGKVTYASSGLASFPWLGAKLIERAAGIEMVHVPFPGDGPAMNSVLSGHVDLLFTPSAKPYVDGGLVKVLGVASLERVASTPDWPTLDEKGLAGFTLVSWVGFMGPANMPKSVVDRLNSVVNEALEEPNVKQRMEQIGYSVAGGSPESFRKAVQDNIDSIRALNLKVD
ncbi:MAG: tripartite tricarboxylate transporter substrate binding protein [Beijerinckiaceae bacterium]|nr:tripartite tricarboxylate transporter substrate binding protein [Beijerinckiaceae bacterium]